MSIEAMIITTAGTAMAVALMLAAEAIKRLQRRAAHQKVMTDELMEAVDTLLEVSRVHTRAIDAILNELESEIGGEENERR